ncbi:MAG TPA: STAS domain-containing protein [Bryobacteraceae bacterium]|nr:STAS domain-containing protein [Bryobacteraceae bacterium]
MSCTVTIREHDDIPIVVLSGKFTITDSSGVIRNCVSGLLGAGHKRILLDLAGVTYLDSAAGIGELVTSYTTALHNNASVKFLHAAKNVYHVLEIAGLHKVFEIYNSEDEAINSFDLKPASSHSSPA